MNRTASNNEIRSIQRRIFLRRADLRQHSANLAQTIKSRITSPAALFASAGIGFILGEITDRRTYQIRPASRAADSAPADTRTFRPYQFIVYAYAAMHSWPVKALSSLLNETSRSRVNRTVPQESSV
jgi:hypothetical protein